MITDEQIKRINELYHKSKSEGLTSDEASEQSALRKAYIASVRASLRGTLDNVDIKEKDGSITHLSDVRKTK